MKRRAAPRSTTTIRFLSTTWNVPRGFGRVYRKIAIDHENTIARHVRYGLVKVCRQVRDLLELIGYTASDEEIQAWGPYRRVEAVVYAANVHARASDNPIPRHPVPPPFAQPAWKGPWKGRDGDPPHPTPIVSWALPHKSYAAAAPLTVRATTAERAAWEHAARGRPLVEWIIDTCNHAIVAFGPRA